MLYIIQMKNVNLAAVYYEKSNMKSALSTTWLLGT